MTSFVDQNSLWDSNYLTAIKNSIIIKISTQKYYNYDLTRLFRHLFHLKKWSSKSFFGITISCLPVFSLIWIVFLFNNGFWFKKTNKQKVINKSRLKWVLTYFERCNALSTHEKDLHLIWWIFLDNLTDLYFQERMRNENVSKMTRR